MTINCEIMPAGAFMTLKGKKEKKNEKDIAFFSLR